MPLESPFTSKSSPPAAVITRKIKEITGLQRQFDKTQPPVGSTQQGRKITIIIS